MVLGGLIEGRVFGGTQQGAAAGRHALDRRPVPQRQPHPQEDQPDGVPAACRDARRQQAANDLSLDRYDSIRAMQQGTQPDHKHRVMRDQRGAGDCRRCASLQPGTRCRQRPHLPPRPAGATEAAAMGAATPCPTPSRRPTPCCSKTTASGSCCGRPRTSVAAGAERGAAPVRRRLRSSASRRRRWSKRIAAAYAGGESSAAVVIGEVESAVDLSRMMQELPAVEDLLEAANDAPIIRMLNALLTQAAKDGASDIHIEPYERSSCGALPRRRHAARGGAAEQGAACGADLAPEDHGRARHRREAPAAGRPHLAAHRRPRDRRARVDAALVARRARRAAPARQGANRSSRSKAWA